MNKISFRQALLIAIGSSIGGGIYFKTDDVLMTSQGDVFLSTMGWIVLGGTFIFAGLAISILANRTKRDGGLIAYMEDCFGEKVGFATGWFFAIFYSPSQIAILAWVTATYGLQIFNFNSENIGVNGFYIVIFLTLVAMFTWNILSTKFAALVSAFSTSVKLIPLLLIPILAFIGLEPANFANITEGTSYVANNPEAIKMITEAGLAYNPDASWLTIFIGPLLAMAFTFDGWFTVGSLSVDMENPQKDLAKVFTISLSVVTFVYAVYHLGVNMLMPADEIIIAGDAHVEYAVRALFGGIFGESGGYAAAKVVIVIVTISVTGATNSFIMGANRYVQALAEEGNFFNPQKYRKFSVKTGTPLSSALAQGLCTFVLLMAYYLQEGHGWFSGIVIDELPVAFEAVFFIPLMIAVIMIWTKDKSVGFFKGFIAPIVGTIGQVFILFAFFTNNEQAVLYFIICIVVIIIGLIFKVAIFDKYRQTDEFKNQVPAMELLEQQLK